MKKVVLVFLLSIFTSIQAGCGVGRATWEDQFLHEYFQCKVGYKYHFRGTGSRFATMDWEIMYREGNRVQVLETSRGVKAALVYRVGDRSIDLIHFDETNPRRNHLHDHNNQHQVVLHVPLEKGARWEDRYTVREVVAVDEKITLPGGEYRAIKVKKQYKGLDAVEYNYFVKGLGFVKSEYITGDVRVITELDKITPAAPKQARVSD